MRVTKTTFFSPPEERFHEPGASSLAVGGSKEAIVELMNQDPFVKRKLAEVNVTEFQTSQMSKEFRMVV